MEVGMPDFGKRQEKIGLKLEKCLISQGLEGGFLPVVPEW